MSRETFAGAVALLVAVQAALIIALLLSRARQRESEARNNAFLRALPDLMFLLTREGVYLDYSAGDETALLVQPSQFLGKNMRDTLPPALADLFAESYARLDAGDELVIVEYEVPVPSGELRHFEARVVRCDSDKILSIVRDVTAQKRAAEELHQAHLELLRASRLATLGEFAGSIAHELAQPLTAIIANSHASLRLLDRETADVPEMRRTLHDVLESGKAAREVIHRTRHLFGHGDPERRVLDLADIINEVRMMVSSTLHARRIALEVQVDVGHRVIRGDRVQLRQVILNLISNGIEAMDQASEDAPRRLSIRATANGAGMVTLTVSDTGVGLGNVDRGRLFNESYTTKPDGMGWGLSISRSIVEAHGGRLWAEPNDAGGASFSFTLPLPS